MNKNDFLFTIENDTFSWFTVERVILRKNIICVETHADCFNYAFDNDEDAQRFYQSITID